MKLMKMLHRWSDLQSGGVWSLRLRHAPQPKGPWRAMRSCSPVSHWTVEQLSAPWKEAGPRDWPYSRSLKLGQRDPDIVSLFWLITLCKVQQLIMQNREEAISKCSTTWQLKDRKEHSGPIRKQRNTYTNLLDEELHIASTLFHVSF